MRILHICNGFIDSTVHQSLNKAIIKNGGGIETIVYIPINYRNRYSVEDIAHLKTNGTTLLYSTILGRRHRFLYKDKIKKIVADVEMQIEDFNDIDYIHSSTLCLDGAVAYELHKRYKRPFSTSVRNTDVNAYFKWFPFYKGYFCKVLEAASRVFFISKKYKEDFLSDLIPNQVAEVINEHCNFIPNGVDEVFLNQRPQQPKELSSPIQLLYVGGIMKNKNIVSIVSALDLLRSEGFGIEFTVIGRGLKHRGDNQYLQIIEELTESRSWFHIKDRVDKYSLHKQLRDFDLFIMPSHHETFGLVYVEALSQGLPIIYTKGQGFDGIFEEGHVGYHVDSNNIIDIKERIKDIINNYNQLSENVINQSLAQFDWNSIAKEYIRIFKQHNS